MYFSEIYILTYLLFNINIRVIVLQPKDTSINITPNKVVKELIRSINNQY